MIRRVCAMLPTQGANRLASQTLAGFPRPPMNSGAMLKNATEFTFRWRACAR